MLRRARAGPVKKLPEAGPCGNPDPPPSFSPSLALPCWRTRAGKEPAQRLVPANRAAEQHFWKAGSMAKGSVGARAAHDVGVSSRTFQTSPLGCSDHLLLPSAGTKFQMLAHGPDLAGSVRVEEEGEKRLSLGTALCCWGQK